MSDEIDTTTTESKLELAMEALSLAEDIMSYCQGDAWERECTEKDRNRFEQIMHKLVPPPPVVPVARSKPLWATRETVRAMFGVTPCPVCGKKVSKEEHAVSQHIRSKHPELNPTAAEARLREALAREYARS